jgi:hypothetical protein
MTNTKTGVSLRLLAPALLLGFFVAAVLPGLPHQNAAAVTSDVQLYQGTGSLQPGSVVEKTKGEASSREVGPASKSRLGGMFGVVVDPARLSVVMSEGLENEVYVATAGTYPALVSTENGTIQTGDYLTLSSIDGTLMKADTRQKTVFGRATGSFTESSVSIGNMTLKDDQGATHSVKLGLVSMTIDIKKNPNIESTKVNVPKFLEDIGQQIAKKEVSPIRIYISMFITAVSLITAIVVLYSGVRNGIISIGRNPMSKRSIFRALLEIILTSIAVLMVGLFAVYLLLRL